MKKALITGITGQDGSFLAEYLLELVCKYVGIDLVWEGTGLEEKGIHSKTGEIIIETDAQYFRPTEVDLLLGDPKKAVDTFGFDPEVTSLETLVQIMMDHDLKYVKHEKEMKQRV